MPSIEVFTGARPQVIEVLRQAGPPGPQGPPGADGAAGGDMLKSVYDANDDEIVDKAALCAINFSFADVSTLPLTLVPAGQRVLRVRLSIDTAFSDPVAALAVGDSINNSRLMSAAQNYPDLEEEFESNPSYLYSVATQVNLYISAGTSSAGSGVVYLYGG